MRSLITPSLETAISFVKGADLSRSGTWVCSFLLSVKFHEIGRIHKLFTTEHDMLESKVLVNDCRFSVSPVIYPDPDPEKKFNFCTINIFGF